QKEADSWEKVITYPLIVQNLKPGTYTLKLRSSIDQSSWVEAKDSVLLTVANPWWSSWWFYLFVIIMISSFLYYFISLLINYRNNKKETLRYDQSIQSLSLSMHKQHEEDEGFWKIILGSIIQNGINVCSVYLLDRNENFFVRKAQLISSEEHKDYLEFPSLLALNQNALSTLKDKQPIPNSKGIQNSNKKSPRSSKAIIPIIIDEQVVGFLNCEDGPKDSFNERKISFLSTIATIIASKLETYRSEQNRQSAEVSLSKNLKKVSELEMKSLRSQMNPHFMFNSLNSINNFIVKNDQENASDYLTSFARLMRIILENSRHDWVSLDSELNALRLYIGMEKLRFEKQFNYHEYIDPVIDLKATLIPPMLIQPFIENAIWHGLLPKKSESSNLKLSFLNEQDQLIVLVDDDGIGTNQSKIRKSNFNVSRKSFGQKIISERIDLINEIYALNAHVKILDKADLNINEQGTQVKLSMKIKTKKHESYNH
ncbi:MAG: histidine kinase, partial [Bacteroidota bacterium]